jgi:hypothetical protein
MPGKLYQGQGEVVTPHIGDTQIHAMYLGSQYVGYDSRYSTYISASGGSIFDSGGYRYHLFTTSADFIIHSLPLSQLNSRMEILVVGAGGGGAPGGSVGSLGAGNGGAVVHIPDSANYRLNVGTYNINIGVGGTAGVDSTPDVIPTSGSRSFISGSEVEITALGGASPANSFISQSGLPGVSGQYGYNFDRGSSTDRGVGGGGGAGEPGDNALSDGCNTGGVGGDGYLVDTFPFSYTYDVGTSAYWGGGGGGESFPNMSGCASPPVFIPKAGGAGGGGFAGDNVLEPTKKNGYPNTGGGGGANIGFTAAGGGGSGFVGFRYRYV